MKKQLTNEKVAQYERDGYCVFPALFDVDTVKTVKQRMAQIVDEVDLTKDSTSIAVFSTENNNREKREEYFIESAWQIKPFFEADALD